MAALLFYHYAIIKGSERAGRMAMSPHRELPFRTKRSVGQSALRQAMIFSLQYERRNSGRKNADFFQEKNIGIRPNRAALCQVERLFQMLKRGVAARTN